MVAVAIEQVIRVAIVDDNKTALERTKHPGCVTFAFPVAAMNGQGW